MDAAPAGPVPRCVALIGGAEAKTGPAFVLRSVLAHTGKATPVVAVCAAASADPGERLEVYTAAFGRLGATVVDVTPSSREHADTPQLSALVAGADAVFVTGGNQSTLTHLVAATSLSRSIARAGARGAVLAGTSAGAAAAAGTMISGGAPTGEDVRLAPGLGWLPGVVVDQHFTQRGRHERLSRALAVASRGRPGVLLGVGVDEDTALLLTGDLWSVTGSGTVTVRSTAGAGRVLRAGDAGRVTDLSGALPRAAGRVRRRRSQVPAVA